MNVPTPDPETARLGLQAMLRERHPLAALQVFHRRLGDVFRVNLPGFSPVFMVGPEAARFVLVQQRGDLRWRSESDPVTDLLRHGLLVEDGREHDELRRLLNPALHRRMLVEYIDGMDTAARQVIDSWPEGGVVDMLVEMRKIALLALMRTLLCVDFTAEMQGLWKSILGCIRYISPGVWMFSSRLPRPGYRKHIARLDAYLYALIAERRRSLARTAEPPLDMLGTLLWSGMDDDRARDQLLTMLIAGHDTVTALMAWTLYLLVSHPQSLADARNEVDRLFQPQASANIESVSRLEYLERSIRESLRLYPPIHLGSRLAAADLEYAGFRIPAGTRVVYSIYLTGRHPVYWPEPDRFLPDRFLQKSPQPYTWLAFGGGPRNCIGAAYGQLEARLVLGRVLQQFDLEPVGSPVHPHMGATLEPHPGVKMRVRRRTRV